MANLCYKLGQDYFFCKLRQTLLQLGTANVLQSEASVITNWDSYDKSGQPLLQNRAVFTNWVNFLLLIGVGITNWSNYYYKLVQALQIRTFITFVAWQVSLHVFWRLGIHFQYQHNIHSRKEKLWSSIFFGNLKV